MTIPTGSTNITCDADCHVVTSTDADAADNLARNRRILIIDDNEAIHNDFQRILCPDGSEGSLHHDLEALLFGDENQLVTRRFELTNAFQGKQGLDAVKNANQDGNPFAVMFVDMRMPPEMDGLETIERIWKMDDEIQTIICTAHSDHSWTDIRDRLGTSDRLLFLKKPFEVIEVLQLAETLSTKWNLTRQTRSTTAKLSATVEQLKASNFELDARARRLTEARQRAEEAKREAQRANRAKSDFLANMSHELRTPMNSILGFAARLRRSRAIDPATPEGDAVETIERNGKRLLQLIEDLFNVSALDSGDMELHRTEVDIRAILEDLVAHASKTAHEKKTCLRLVVPPIPLIASIDAGHIRQAISRLITNAIEFAPSGEITVSAEAGTSAGIPQIQIAVADHGPGIAQKDIPTLFKRFSQLKESQKRCKRGAGLGLALAKGFVELHGGTITVESEVDTGSRFTIRLPVQAVPLQSDGHASKPG